MTREYQDELMTLVMKNTDYTEAEALKAIINVKAAMKSQRELLLKEYLNCRVLFEHDGLHIQGIITDVKVTELGSAFQVTPIAGSKSKWISNFISKI